MAKVNGHGGFWVVMDVDQEPVTVHNAEYTVDLENDIRETNSAGGGNWTEGLPKINRVRAAVLKVAEDDVAYPQALGFTEGVEITVWLRRGALNEWDKIANTVVRIVRVVNDQQRARRCEIVCEHGAYSRGVADPTAP